MTFDAWVFAVAWAVAPSHLPSISDVMAEVVLIVNDCMGDILSSVVSKV